MCYMKNEMLQKGKKMKFRNNEKSWFFMKKYF